MPVPSFEHQRRYSVTRLSSGYTSVGMDNQFSYDPSASTNTRIALPTLPTFMATPHAPTGYTITLQRIFALSLASASTIGQPRANNADVEDPEDIFNDGTTVFVRRLQADAQRAFWSEWRQGTIVRYQPLRHYLGCSAHAYIVAIPRERGPSTHAVFTRYLGEICLPREMPRIGRLFVLHSCLQKQRQLNLVFVRCDLDKAADVCTPAEIVGVLPGVSHKFLDFRLENLACVDKTPYAFQLPERFRYLLLRPRRFGKSAFLSLLRQCYDASARPRFTQIFGESSASERFCQADNIHLCLDIGFYPITDASLDEIADDVRLQIKSALWTFLDKYSTQLGVRDIPQILESGGDPLATVISLVRAAGLSLFVNVDDFDALFRLPRRSFASTTRASVREIDDVLTSLLWHPLLAGRDVTPKFIVSAAVLPEAALVERLELHAAPELDSVCGFTLSEAEKLVSGFLEERTVNLRDVCGTYIFSETTAEPLLHPQQVLALAKHSSKPTEIPFKTLASLLAMLRQSSRSSDEVSRQDIVALVVSGAVTVPTSPDAFVDGDLGRPTWHAFVGAGALMRDPRSPQTLRMSPVPSVLELFHSCIDETIAERFNLRGDLLGPWGEFNAFQPDRWVDLLQHALRSFSRDLRGRGHEPTLHGVFELILRNANTRKTHVIPPPPLVFKAPRGGDILELPGYRKGATIVLELATITLLELWRGGNPNADTQTPDKDELEALYEKVLGQSEEALLGRQYRAWSSELEAMESKLVEHVVKTDLAHIQLVAIGGAHVLYRGRREEVPELCGPRECDMGDFSGW
ncbi:AAA-ATPase-like domain-containing protein [Mycena chlorophos]|uniref:AAA-ATPase-like domain-containing protein n=1 Tax=Mycena chlorophos TaxID=658473 RepID=A0A8H6TJU6_MYCCL|nr:AAA-ATPase-like domain-containing protein [Mycena chlorophos]